MMGSKERLKSITKSAGEQPVGVGAARIIQAAGQLRDHLVRLDARVVFAESCTAGRAASSLATLPGISQYHCGGFIVYRCASKSDWLGVDPQLLDDPGIGPVSLLVTRKLAVAALQKTAEATVAVAITGEIGPLPPNAQASDGQLYGCLAIERSLIEILDDRITSASSRESSPEHVIFEFSHRLSEPAPKDANDIAARIVRLDSATCWLLENATETLARLSKRTD